MTSNLADLWQKSGGDDPLGGKSFQEFFSEQPGNELAYQLTDRELRCIDEGTTGGLHLAGSGILYDRAAADLSGKVSGIWSHAGCGAAALYCKNNKLDQDSDEAGDQKARELAQSLGVSYLGRIRADQMSRPDDLHVARIIYVTNGDFDPSRVRGLPQGFIINRNMISDEAYAKSEVELAIQIALGDHGFGNKFTKDSPLYIILVDCLGNPTLDQMRKEVEELESKYPVKVDTLSK